MTRGCPRLPWCGGIRPDTGGGRRSVRRRWSSSRVHRRSALVPRSPGLNGPRSSLPPLSPPAPPWRVPYERDVLDPWIRLMTSGGARLAWIGNTVVSDPRLNGRLHDYEPVLRALPERWPQVTYVDPALALNGGPGPEFHDVV